MSQESANKKQRLSPSLELAETDSIAQPEGLARTDSLDWPRNAHPPRLIHQNAQADTSAILGPDPVPGELIRQNALVPLPTPLVRQNAVSDLNELKRKRGGKFRRSSKQRKTRRMKKSRSSRRKSSRRR